MNLINSPPQAPFFAFWRDGVRPQKQSETNWDYWFDDWMLQKAFETNPNPENNECVIGFPMPFTYFHTSWAPRRISPHSFQLLAAFRRFSGGLAE